MGNDDSKNASLIDPQAFLLAEYESLRREIELERKEIGEYLRYAIVSSGAVWAWLLFPSHPRISRIGWFIPVGLSSLLFVQALVLRRKIFGLGDYIQTIEKACVLPNSLRWETQLRGGGAKRGWVAFWENTIWVFLCLGNLALAVFVLYRAGNI